MNEILLVRVIKEKPLLVVALAAVMFFVTPVIQSFNTSLAFEIWFRDLYQKPLNSSLYIIFSILFGMFMTLYLYSRNICIDCKTSKATKSGISGTILGFMIGVCPACFSFIGFLVPLSASLFLTSFAPIFMTASIAIILYSIYRVGGFKPISVNREIEP
ncbi:MAG: hypothetical protein E6L03_10025 [Thaumarchaeota archaeon]|nr:MAG: hypothetical protein E6L03_10025 [Nitrososphaerota archaeon]